MTLAKRGVSWAQNYVGRCMLRGVGGFKKQEKCGLEWLNKAVAQNHPPAIYYLATSYGDGMAPVLRKSEEKAKQLLMKSANLGFALANSNSLLAQSFFCGSRGFEKDQDEAYFRASVAFALDDTNQEVAEVLGRLHYFRPGIPKPSPYIACYYLNIAANEDKNGTACYFCSNELVDLSKHLLHSQDRIPGFNVMPSAFFWLRKSRDMGYSKARKVLKEWESVGQSRCANCSKEAKTGEKFKQCSKCKAQWYCSKECQVEAWKAGHKKDCKRATILKFEDYLNAE